MIWKLFRRRLDECKIIVSLSVGLYILSTILLAIIVNTSNEEETTFAIGSAMLVMISVFFFLFMGVFGYSIEFNLAIGMGVTRKQFVPAYFITSIMLLVVESAIVYVGFFIERWEIRTFYSQYEYERGVEGLLFSKYMIIAIIALAVFQAFAGAMAMKFGKKSFWVVWAATMLVGILPGKIEKAMKRADGSFLDQLGQNLMKFFTHMNSTMGTVVIIVVIVAVLGITYLIQRKQAYSVI